MNTSRLRQLEQRAVLLDRRPTEIERPVVPDIVEFVESDRYLHRPGLYPRQYSVLKLMFLQDHLFTEYDFTVLEQWASSFERGLNQGVQPDVVDRMKECQRQGRKYFREVVALIGRRGSKNYLGAIATAYVTWLYLSKGDPQSSYGLDRGQRISYLVFAGNYLQAKTIQFDLIERVITEAPCFAPFVAGRARGGRLLLLTPNDLERLGDREFSEQERLRAATMEILAKETTLLAGRGPTAFGHTWDEMAHATASASSSSADEVFPAAIPSLDQFGRDGFIYEPSTPWQMTGQFYENFLRSLSTAPDGSAIHPEVLMLQLSSFELYRDWEKAHEIPMSPGGRYCARKKRAIQAFDEDMKKEKRTNPERFDTERMSQWATVQDSYLPRDQVAEIFQPWQGRQLLMQTSGLLRASYWAHADPGRVGSDFALAVAHVEELAGVIHVVFDLLRVWRATDFSTGRIDFRKVKEDLCEVINKFHPRDFTFDQWNSASFVDELDYYARKANLPNPVAVSEITSTFTHNHNRAETFKAVLSQGRIHVPYRDEGGDPYLASQLLEQQLLFLQERGGKVDHPTSGPVTKKDLADCAMECVCSLVDQGGHESAAEQLSSLPLGASMPGGWSDRPQGDADVDAAFSAAGRFRDMQSRSAARGGRFF